MIFGRKKRVPKRKPLVLGNDVGLGVAHAAAEVADTVATFMVFEALADLAGGACDAVGEMAGSLGDFS